MILVLHDDACSAIGAMIVQVPVWVGRAIHAGLSYIYFPALLLIHSVTALPAWTLYMLCNKKKDIYIYTYLFIHIHIYIRIKS